MNQDLIIMGTKKQVSLQEAEEKGYKPYFSMQDIKEKAVEVGNKDFDNFEFDEEFSNEFFVETGCYYFDSNCVIRELIELDVEKITNFDFSDYVYWKIERKRLIDLSEKLSRITYDEFLEMEKEEKNEYLNGKKDKCNTKKIEDVLFITAKVEYVEYDKKYKGSKFTYRPYISIAFVTFKSNEKRVRVGSHFILLSNLTLLEVATRKSGYLSKEELEKTKNKKIGRFTLENGILNEKENI